MDYTQQLTLGPLETMVPAATENWGSSSSLARQKCADADGKPAAKTARKKSEKSTALTTSIAPTAKIDGVEAELLTREEQEALVKTMSSDELSRFYLSNESEGRVHYQRSLELFEEGVAIIDAREELLLKKTSERMRFKKPLKLLQRQLLNTLLFVARPEMSTRDTFKVRLDYLSWATQHVVNGFSYLQKSLEELQESLMQVSHSDSWFSTPAIHEVFIEKNVLYYKLPPIVQRLYAAPERYYHISMRMNAVFRSKYTHAMYEMLKESQWRRETDFMTIAEFRERMGIEEDEYPEFKRLASRAIAPALKELEEVADYYATVKYRYEGRKVIALNFIIHENAKNALKFDEANLTPECFAMLREEFGLNPKQITELTQNHSATQIQDIVDVLFYRYICRKKVVRNGFRLVQNALSDTEDKYFLTNQEKAELTLIKERKQQAEQVAQVEQAQRETQLTLSERFAAWWEKLPATERQTVWDLFLAEGESAALRQARKARRGSAPDLTSPLARVGLTTFAARTGQLPEAA